MASLIEKNIKKNEPFLWKNLLWHPLTVEDYLYEEEIIKIICIMQQSLDIRYMQLTYLRMLFTIDIDNIRIGKSSSFVIDLFKLLCMLLHFDYTIYDRKEVKKSELPIRLYFNKDKNLCLGIKNGDQEVEISEYEFIRLRELIAKANEIELPDEATNLELINWEKEKRLQSNEDLEDEFENAIDAVVAHQRKNKKEILSMTIREFKRLFRAIDNEINHLICSLLAQSGAVKFSNGNPYPSWCYPKKRERVEVEKTESLERKRAQLL